MPKASEIAAALDVPLRGKDIDVVAPSSLARAGPGRLVFLSKAHSETIERLNAIGALLCIAAPDTSERLTCSVLTHDSPRLGFCLALSQFFVPAQIVGGSTDATIDPTAVIGVGVSIGAGVRIGPNVTIGDRCLIGENCVVGGPARIGNDCVIKPNTTIGARGFGFADDKEGVPVSFPHIGGVVIGNAVEIGANCTVARAALDDTVICDYVKLDDHVHIAHNCIIGSRSKIAAGAIFSGSVTLGEGVWISPNVTILDYTTVGDGAFVGIGSVVTKPVDSGTRVFGVPAKRIGR